MFLGIIPSVSLLCAHLCGVLSDVGAVGGLVVGMRIEIIYKRVTLSGTQSCHHSTCYPKGHPAACCIFQSACLQAETKVFTARCTTARRSA